jgi:uncharacterized membrane protein YccC
MDSSDLGSAAVHALRVAVAAVLSLVLVEYWQLEHANLAVWSGFMATAQYQYTAFQKGLERIVGRGFGILVGLVILAVDQRAPVLGVALENWAILALFYVAYSGQFAYTFLNAGLYLAVITLVGRANPAEATHEARSLFLAVSLGVVASDIVNWVSGAERTLGIVPGGAPLFPLRHDWLAHSARLALTVLLTRVAAAELDLSVSSAIVSVMILSTAADLPALLHKGRLRLAGAVLGGAWGVGSFMLLRQVPHFPLLAALIFLGTYLAAYAARVAGASSYAGLQMGLVLLMVIVVPPTDLDSVHGAVERGVGVVIALVASMLVAGVWAAFHAPAPAPANVPPQR